MILAVTEQPTDYESPTGPLSEGDLTLLPGQTATLAVEEGGPPLLIPLGQRPLLIGRAPGNDLVLASRFVSKQHARIDPRDGGHLITDLGSTNGLLYGGQRLRPRRAYPLRDGDVLRIGDPQTGGLVTLTYRNNRVARRQAANRQQRSFPLAETALTLGRSGCDITLDNPLVSRCHARIVADGAGHSFSDLGSTNGSFVNGRRLNGTLALGRGDIIQIGPFKLVYQGDRLDAYDQRGALQLDARMLMRGVGAGALRRLILREVSLSIRPREFVAIVGGSGSGKSTLLMALAGVVRADSGSVLLNGDNLYAGFAAYRQTIAYVPQDDILHPQLTVEEALGYAARLRLPTDTAGDEIERRIQRVLDDVDLAHVRGTLIERLSGGQRKRASIGVELLADPSLFFLDEPTSGLDPGLEKRLMYTLRRLADGGRTVVLVTHATTNISACDHVAFLGQGGRLVFFGPPHEALTFFGVADFADIYTRLEGQALPQEPWLRDLLGRYYTAWHAANSGRGEPPLAELWAAAFADSAQHQRYIAERLAAGAADTGVALLPYVPDLKPRDQALRQLGILTRRYGRLLLRDRRNLALLLAQAPIIGLLLLLLARPNALTGSGAYASEARKVLFMLAMVIIWCGVLNAAREIVKERTIYRRERLASLRIGAYVLSKLLVLSGVVVVQSVALLILLGLRIALPPFGVMLPGWAELGVTTLLAGLAGTALGLLISALARNPDRAMSLAPLVLIPQILFAGLIFRLEQGLNLPRLLSWLTISRWAMDAYGATVDLNRLPFAPGLLPIPSAEYMPNPTQLLSRWAILMLYTLVCVAATIYVLKRQDTE